MTRILSEHELDILRHMLGINDSRARDPVPTRDYYCANIDDPHLVELDRLGMVEKYSEHGRYWWYRTTRAGAAAAIASFYARRATKAQRVYLRFLDHHEVYQDLTFKEFLTAAQFAAARREA